MKQNYLLGVFLCFFAVLSWGGMFPVMNTALKMINPFMFTAIRYTSAALLFLLFLYYKEGKASFGLDGMALTVWILGSLGFAGFGFLVFLGQKMASQSGAISASVVMALMPLLSVVINWIFRGIRPLRFTLGFVLMSFSGVLCVVTKGDFASLLLLRGNVLADLLILLGALCWVIYTIGSSSFPRWSALRYTTLTTALGVPTIWLVNVVLTILGRNPLPGLGTIASVGPQIAYMVLVAAFLGVLAWNSGNKIVTPINGVLFMDIVPITTFTISAFNGYVFNGAELIGAGLTIAALVLNNLYQRMISIRPEVTNTVIKPRSMPPCLITGPNLANNPAGD